MALNRAPLTEGYTLILKHDSAVNAELENFEHEWTVAVETLKWDRVLRPGERPTEFHCRPIAAEPWRSFLEQYTVTRADDNGRDVTVPTALGLVLLVRMALHSVTNWDGVSVKRAVDRDHKVLGAMADSGVIEDLDAIDRADGRPYGTSVADLGLMVYVRQLLAPKR